MYFWDVFTPLLYIIFFTNLFFSYKYYKKKSIGLFFVTIVINIFISFLGLWSIGIYLFIISCIQLSFLLILIRKNKLHRN